MSDTEDHANAQISPYDILGAYCNGYFPMAPEHDSPLEEIGWFDPPMRGIIPLERFHIPRSLKRFMRQSDFQVTLNDDFSAVIEACAAIGETRDESWINPQIITWFETLHELGFAHSVEVRANDEAHTLIGGLYGLSIGGAFFGESMFSKQSNASRIALIYLIYHAMRQGLSLLDTQFVNDHLLQFGCVEIPKKEYLVQLHDAIEKPIRFAQHDELIDNKGLFTEKPQEILNFIDIWQAQHIQADAEKKY